MTSRFRLLSSEDSGKNWQVNDPTANVPLIWWAPCGRVIEISDDALVMPVYGAASQTDLKATIHNCGLLRSRDGGKSWGEFSWIAQGGSRMVGAAAISRFSFEGPSVQPLPDGRWLAMAITYDEGRSFDYLLTGPYETNNAFVHGTDEFVIFTSKSHRSDSSAGVYRWVPN